MSLTIPALKIATAAIVIAVASWLAGRKPEIAGFIIALPIASLLALAFAHMEHQDSVASITFAKSILVGVPASYLFFVPFFFADRMGNNFWLIYSVGLSLLIVGFVVHRFVMGWLQ